MSGRTIAQVQIRELTFLSRSETCAATFYRPESGVPAPCVVMAHGFSSTQAEGLQDYAERFAAAGFCALTFDYRHFGRSSGSPRQLISIRRQLKDYRAAIACARNLPGVDATRIVLWGSSFSGGHVLKLAAKDHKIAAVIAQTPFTDGRSAIKAAERKNVVKGVAYGVADAGGSLIGRDPVYVPVVGPPGSFAAMTEEGAEKGQQELVSEQSTWRNEVAARIGLSVGAYRPAAKVGRIRCPLLVCVATADATTPPGPAERVARRAPRGELREYACGHFDIYQGEWFERMVSDEVAFLQRHLGTT
ncbi:MAG TPA: alpha/beta hydrolase [Baekduia sp.]|nr:alpha/beta hydrolase [Baekduia sp.]